MTHRTIAAADVSRMCSNRIIYVSIICVLHIYIDMYTYVYDMYTYIYMICIYIYTYIYI